MNPTLLVVLDLGAAIATLALVAFFVVAWRRSAAPLHLLMGLGFLLLAASFGLVSSSEFDLVGEADVIDALRFVGQTAGALVLALGYVASARGRIASPAHVLAWAAGCVALLLAVVLLVLPPVARLPSEHDVALVAHLAQAVCFAACAALSSAPFRRVPTLDRALVPGAFASWMLSKYTWVLIDLSGARELVPFAYAWRFGAIALLLLALALPVRLPARLATRAIPEGRT